MEGESHCGVPCLDEHGEMGFPPFRFKRLVLIFLHWFAITLHKKDSTKIYQKSRF